MYKTEPYQIQIKSYYIINKRERDCNSQYFYQNLGKTFFALSLAQAETMISVKS